MCFIRRTLRIEPLTAVGTFSQLFIFMYNTDKIMPQITQCCWRIGAAYMLFEWHSVCWLQKTFWRYPLIKSWIAACTETLDPQYFASVNQYEEVCEHIPPQSARFLGKTARLTCRQIHTEMSRTGSMKTYAHTRQSRKMSSSEIRNTENNVKNISWFGAGYMCPTLYSANFICHGDHEICKAQI